MKRRITSLGVCVGLAMILGAAPFAGARPSPKADKTSDAARPGTAPNADKSSGDPAQKTDYVGADACKACHENIYQSYDKSPHRKTLDDTRGGPSKQGCEACHGPGAAHVAGGGDVSKIFIFKNHSAKEIDDQCLACHAGGTEHAHAINSIHGKNGVGCISCHSIHHAATSEFQLAKAEPELCFGCHLHQKAQFAMPFHHRVNEGLVTCTDCHNVHGTAGPKQVRMSSTQDAVCFKCHTDKQGPFVYEHATVKVEGCSSCHTPHGSPNAKMLKVNNVNMLCLQCHTASSFSGAAGTPSFHNQSTYFQACTLCHVQIHGSNFNAFYFR